ncbi:putative F-box domain-containing protein [Rosellinia necatrix]|uniref:Putative F-box domain-containing protein n=1 Tax=Rosellinia necatrix TaxID=77044 RepID=A0A1W2TDJ6_ROSNE|nr:putative F-box domain-containing protein [Rosellinia necatrix]
MASGANTCSPGTEESPAQHPHSHTKSENSHVPPEPPVGEGRPPASMSPAILQLMEDKNQEWEGTKNKGTPLTLLSLPVDVLRLIVKEITYTNDLIALALTHSALYKLAVPSVYSRFDIVWPDTSAPATNSKSVDALSYGLATLCLPNRFAETAKRLRGGSRGQSRGSHRLAKNDYAKYVRKFSIGDGPVDWTSEYLITKESGKMLGTLVAIAVSKMVNLETFVWDMPTGVLSDVFMALSSLEDNEGRASLEKPKGYAQSRVEYPTFSVLPPLKSLTVLDIDDISYLDEMSVLIERSVSHLRELQVGISEKAYNLHDFAQPWDGANLQQVDHEARWPGESRIPSTRLGGVLGVLVGRIYDIRRKPDPEVYEELAPEQTIDLPTDEKTAGPPNEADKVLQPQGIVNGDLSNPFLSRKRLDGKLGLETLALERVTLSIAVCSRAFDWSIMTSLTILGCQHHDSLWKALRRQFQPTAPAHGASHGTSTQYHLALKHISTDLVSPALVSFMKETIAPNTLESIFLHDRQNTQKPSVTVEQVFRCTAKRHRNSLKKLLLDSSEKSHAPTVLPGARRRFRHWAIGGEALTFITSGKMTSLRELGMVIDYRDWHTLLQQLPQMTNLRSLYIPHIYGRYSPQHLVPRELALNIVDVISLRREIQLTYVAIQNKCFEIVELTPGDSVNNRFQSDDHHAVLVEDIDPAGNPTAADIETDEEPDDEDDDLFIDADDEIVEEASDDESEADSSAEATTNKSLPRLRLREILFYDDKVELFRARHGKL